MARKGQLNSNEKKAKLIKKHAHKRAELLAFIKDKNTTLAQRFQAVLKLSAMPRNSSPSRYRNRCQLTGRARGYYNRFNVSRIVLRELGSAGMMPGLKKSSW